MIGKRLTGDGLAVFLFKYQCVIFGFAATRSLSGTYFALFKKHFIKKAAIFCSLCMKLLH